MKAFLVTFLAAAATAEPQVFLPGYQTAGFNGYTSGLVGGMPLVAQPQHSLYYQPLVQHKFAEQKKFEETKIQEEKKKEMPMEEHMPKVESYMAKKPEQYKYVAAAQPAMAYATYPYGQAAYPSYVAKSAGAQHTVFKREAEAEAEAFLPYGALPASMYNYNPYTAQKIVPAMYNQWYGQQQQQVIPTVYKHQQYPFVGQAQTYANDFVKPQHYASKGKYFAQSAGATHIAKRDAEADAFMPYGAIPHMYNTHHQQQVIPASVYNYHPYTAQKVVPTVYSHPMYNYAAAFAAPQLKSYANDAAKPEQYASKGQYFAQSAGATHIAKRDAEADAQYYRTAVPSLYRQPLTTYNRAATAFPFNTYNTPINSYPHYNNFGYVY